MYAKTLLSFATVALAGSSTVMAMGDNPSTCKINENVEVLEIKLVNIMGPNGQLTNVTMWPNGPAAPPQVVAGPTFYLDIALKSPAPTVEGQQSWYSQSLWGYGMGSCVLTPENSDPSLAEQFPPQGGYVQWVESVESTTGNQPIGVWDFEVGVNYFDTDIPLQIEYVSST